jgi:hypothetical protein
MEVYEKAIRLHAGTDPNEMRFKRAACTADVGLECGGWGRVIMEIRMVDRRKDGYDVAE